MEKHIDKMKTELKKSIQGKDRRSKTQILRAKKVEGHSYKSGEQNIKHELEKLKWTVSLIQE